MAKKIKGNRDGENGRNESYTIKGRGTVTRNQLVKEVDAGKHPNFSTYEINNISGVRVNLISGAGSNR